MNRFNILLRVCDRVESVHGARRPFGFNKKETIKIAFNSLYRSLQRYSHTITVLGDGLSQEMLEFFSYFEGVHVINEEMGSARASLQKQIEMGLTFPEDEWLYFLEDDYLHQKHAFLYLDEFITHRQEILKTSPKRKNRMNWLVGDLARKPLVIHPPDYPDRYLPDFRRHSYLFLSKYCHWRQITNTTHTFMLEGRTLRRFIKSIQQSAVEPSDTKLSEKVYGRILLWNRALCVSPIPSLAAHLTVDTMPPLVDWEATCRENVADLKAGDQWV